MNYVIEEMAKALKAARARRGLSQRELSLRSGVPQSHISKIESGAVDLRVSSLIGLARELGLELALIPRKAVPAVSSIIRSSERQMRDPLIGASDKIKRDLQKIENVIIRNSKKTSLNLPDLARLQQQVRELKHFVIPIANHDKILDIRNAVERMDIPANFELAVAQIDSLRNALAHTNFYEEPEQFPRSAYRLDGDEDV